MKSIRFALLAALATGLLAAGCGSDDNNDKQSFGTSIGSASTSSLSKADFLAQANQICETSNQELSQASQALGDSPTPEEQTSFITDNVLPSLQQQLDDIAALGAPAGDENQVNAILEAAGSALRQVEADPAVLVDGSPNPFADANQLADGYGLAACGSGSSDAGGAGDPGASTTDTGAAGSTETGASGSAPESGPPGTDSNDDGISDPSG